MTHDPIRGRAPDDEAGDDGTTALDDTDRDDTDLDDPMDLDESFDDADGLGEQLRSLIDPAADLTERTLDDVEGTMRARSALAMGLDLLGVGWWTVTAILTDEPSCADQEVEGH